MTEIKDQALKAAIRIGRNLCATAFWDDDGRRCTWMGRTDVEDASGAGYAAATAALGPQLYAGSAGVALFLVELYGLTRDYEAGRTAEGALRRAARYLRNNATLTSALSFYQSHLGVAYVIARATDHGLAADLVDEANWLIDEAAAALKGEHLLDLLSGNAGAIPALLDLARRPDFERCADIARACGEDLCRSAVSNGPVYWWDSVTGSGPSFVSPPLTGYSHGACAMAVALLELNVRQPDPVFLRVARGAFAYEDTLFNPAQANWVDVRFPYGEYGGGLSGSFQTTWCHGAPGIGLTRLRAMRLDPEQAAYHESLARAALGTTLTALDTSLQSPRFDATLCHGLAGLAEIVQIYAETIDDDNARQVVQNTAAELIRRYDEAGDWPSGQMTGGLNPTLMLGNAGIGHHLLRLHAPQAVPSVLIIESRSTEAQTAGSAR